MKSRLDTALRCSANQIKAIDEVYTDATQRKSIRIGGKAKIDEPAVHPGDPGGTDRRRFLGTLPVRTALRRSRLSMPHRIDTKDFSFMGSKSQRRWILVAVLSSLCTLSLPWPPASANPSLGGAVAQKADWQRKCERRAQQNGMRHKLRPPFVMQCIAGYRINAGKDLQSKKQKF